MRKVYKRTGHTQFDNAIIAFDNHLAISGKAIATRKAYNLSLIRFLKISNKLPEHCSKIEIVDTILKIKEIHGFGPSTLKHYIYGIRYYLKHIAERMDLFMKIPIPTLKVYDFDVLNVEEIQLIFKNCNNIRDLFILQLLYETGIRLNELLSINYQDFDLYHKTLTIRNIKNNKTRVVYFGESMKRLLIEYHTQYRSLFSKTKNEFQFHPFIHLSRSGVRYMMQSVVKRSGIQKHVSCHLFRHAFAVHYLNFGGQIYQLQKLLGHSHINTTLLYLQYAILAPAENISILDTLLDANKEINTSLIRA